MDRFFEGKIWKSKGFFEQIYVSSAVPVDIFLDDQAEVVVFEWYEWVL